MGSGGDFECGGVCDGVSLYYHQQKEVRDALCNAQYVPHLFLLPGLDPLHQDITPVSSGIDRSQVNNNTQINLKKESESCCNLMQIRLLLVAIYSFDTILTFLIALSKAIFLLKGSTKNHR